MPLKSGSHLDPRFLFYGLKHPTFLAYVEAESHGLNMPRLGTDAGKAAPFVLAPLAEQKRIADKLEAVLRRVDAHRKVFHQVEGIRRICKGRYRPQLVGRRLDHAALACLNVAVVDPLVGRSVPGAFPPEKPWIFIASCGWYLHN